MASFSFALRALAALTLLVGFYVLSAAMAFGLAYVPYAMVVYAHRIQPQLILICLAASFTILRASIFLPRPSMPAPGPEILPDEQPELFALIRDVAGQMKTRMPAHVYLIPDVNAFVAEVGGFMGFGSRRIMGIGLGLLHVDDASQLRATIAHEFGHYAGGDTRLGGVVYATRAAIGNVIGHLGKGWLQKPFSAYGHFYLLVTTRLGRSQELEADRAGIRVAGREAHVEGLKREMRAGVLLSSFVGSELVPLLREGVCPRPLFAGFRTFVARAPADKVDRAIAERPVDRFDTHPSLAERLSFAAGVPDPEVAYDRRDAISLLRNADVWEERVEPYMFNAVGVRGALKRIPWDEIVPVFYGPKLAEEARSLGQRLFPILGAGPQYGHVLTALADALIRGDRGAVVRAVEPKIVSVTMDRRTEIEDGILGRAIGVILGATLVERGGSWETGVGEDLAVRLDGERYPVFELSRKALATPGDLKKYAAAPAVTSFAAPG
jgi:Zn-dependent protease with chaperone function